MTVLRYCALADDVFVVEPGDDLCEVCDCNPIDFTSESVKKAFLGYRDRIKELERSNGTQ